MTKFLEPASAVPVIRMCCSRSWRCTEHRRRRLCKQPLTHFASSSSSSSSCWWRCVRRLGAATFFGAGLGPAPRRQQTQAQAEVQRLAVAVHWSGTSTSPLFLACLQATQLELGNSASSAVAGSSRSNVPGRWMVPEGLRPSALIAIAASLAPLEWPHNVRTASLVGRDGACA